MAWPWKGNPSVPGGAPLDRVGLLFRAVVSIDAFSIAGFADIVEPAFVIHSL
jgi:hypothetical protein